MEADSCGGEDRVGDGRGDGHDRGLAGITCSTPSGACLPWAALESPAARTFGPTPES